MYEHSPPAGFSLGKQNGRTGNFGGQSHLINFPVFVSPWHLPPLLQGFGLQAKTNWIDFLTDTIVYDILSK